MHVLYECISKWEFYMRGSKTMFRPVFRGRPVRYDKYQVENGKLGKWSRFELFY
jgi:hypothetical protein